MPHIQMHSEKERREYTHPVRQKKARLHQIRIQDMRVRMQGYTRRLDFSSRQNCKKTQSTSLFTFRQSGDSCANILKRRAAILSHQEETIQSRDSARSKL